MGIGFYDAGIIATLAVHLIMAKFKGIEIRFKLSNTWFSVYIELDEIKRLRIFMIV